MSDKLYNKTIDVYFRLKHFKYRHCSSPMTHFIPKKSFLTSDNLIRNFTRQADE